MAWSMCRLSAPMLYGTGLSTVIQLLSAGSAELSFASSTISRNSMISATRSRFS